MVEEPPASKQGTKEVSAWAALSELAKAAPYILLCAVILVVIAKFHKDVERLILNTSKFGVGPVTWEITQQKIVSLNLTFNPKLDKIDELSREQADFLTKRFQEAAADAGPINILWVDDHPRNNLQLVDIFQSMGFQVVVARSPDEAKTRFDERPFNLVISDFFHDQIKDGQAIKARVGPDVAAMVGKRCGPRTVIYSSSWTENSVTPPYVFRETNSFYSLLHWSADLIEEPLEPRCFESQVESTTPSSLSFDQGSDDPAATQRSGN